MKYINFPLFLLCLLSACNVGAQNVLPGITVKNFGGKIIVSWRNEFTSPVSNIFIQRSFDSLKNYTTIGTVLNPQSNENGYSDINPPYTKMYYRVSISFEGGSYQVSAPVRPVKEAASTNLSGNETRYPWQANPGDSSTKTGNEITYPSQRIFTGIDNNIVDSPEGCARKKYTAKIFDDKDSLLFELTKLRDEYLIIEKVNFGHAGWFHFEVYENGILIEKNKFQVSRDGKAAGKLN